MEKQNEKQAVGKELKALGSELAVALKQIRSSQEFQHLEAEVVAGIKNIASSLGTSLKAAKKSPQTKKIARQLGRVAAASAVKGKAEAIRAQEAAVVGLRKVRTAVSDLTDRIKARASAKKAKASKKNHHTTPA